MNKMILFNSPVFALAALFGVLVIVPSASAQYDYSLSGQKTNPCSNLDYTLGVRNHSYSPQQNIIDSNQYLEKLNRKAQEFERKTNQSCDGAFDAEHSALNAERNARIDRDRQRGARYAAGAKRSREAHASFLQEAEYYATRARELRETIHHYQQNNETNYRSTNTWEPMMQSQYDIFQPIVPNIDIGGSMPTIQYNGFHQVPTNDRSNYNH